MEQKKFTDVVRLGHKSTVDVLQVGDKIVIQEKLDGANASFTLDNDELHAFSRNRKLDASNTLGGFYEFIVIKFKDNNHLLNEDYIYFGEWLNPHKVKYEGYEKQFFLFDIYSKSKHNYLEFKEVEHEAITLGLNLIPVFYQGEYESFEQLESYVGQTKVNGKIGDNQLGEGIVVKNVDYRDRFGNQLYVKMVVDEFREVQKQKKAKNPSEYMNTPEYILAESLATKGRIDKIIYKLRDEAVIGSEIDKKDIGLVFKECNLRTYEDILKEESDSLVDINVEDFRKYTSSFAKKYAREHLMEIGAI